MRSSICKLIAGSFFLGASAVYGQAPADPQDAQPINPPARVQPNQQGGGARSPQRAFNSGGLRNNRHPQDEVDAARRLAELQNRQNGQNGQSEGQSGGESDPSQFIGGGGYSSGGGGGVVTAAQGEMMGAADVIRSGGEYNRNTATAGLIQQHAIDKAIDNRQQQVENYFEVRRLNRELRNAERGPVPTQQDAIRYSQSRVPERLTLASLDRQTGAIRWPAALMIPAFDEHRARMEQVFQARSHYNSGVASPSYSEIKDESERMLVTLKDHVREMDPAAYVQARKFIIGLGYEARFMPTNEGLIAG